MTEADNFLPYAARVRNKKIAFLGDYLPRKCGIATFATLSLDDVLAATE